MIKPQILLADDEDSIRQSYAILLTEQFDVVEARNGKEALDLFAAGKFDLVITDYNMPLLKGDALARRMREIHPEQRIIMITAFQPRSTEGVDEVLHKPCTLEELRGSISRLLEHRPAKANGKKH